MSATATTLLRIPKADFTTAGAENINLAVFRDELNNLAVSASTQSVTFSASNVLVEYNNLVTPAEVALVDAAVIAHEGGAFSSIDGVGKDDAVQSTGGVDGWVDALLLAQNNLPGGTYEVRYQCEYRATVGGTAEVRVRLNTKTASAYTTGESGVIADTDFTPYVGFDTLTIPPGDRIVLKMQMRRGVTDMEIQRVRLRLRRMEE